MSFLDRIFRRNMIDCPRCLGKGNVDLVDIRRLKKELFWAPGKCAYCNGIGKVHADRIEKVAVDVEYLTNDLSSWERQQVIGGDKEALQRADKYKKFIQNTISEIEHLYYIENKEPGEIADYLLEKRNQRVLLKSKKQELVGYIEKVIKSKLKG